MMDEEKLIQFHRYDPTKGPTPESVIFDLLEAINHSHLLSTKDRRKTREMLEERTGLANDRERLAMAIELLGLGA